MDECIANTGETTYLKVGLKDAMGIFAFRLPDGGAPADPFPDCGRVVAPDLGCVDRSVCSDGE